MKKTGKEFFCGHLWEKGKREKNEDSLAYWHMKKGNKHQILAIICDGIGGLAEGEQASSYVVRQIVNWFMTEGYKINKIKKVENRIQQLVYQLHEELKDYGKEKHIRLGTTMTLLWMENSRYLWVHCGDCRLYQIRKGKVRKLTQEHCEKNGAVNQAIGVGEWKLLAVGKGKIRLGEFFLLCTDGFYRKLDGEILSILAKRNVKEEEQVNRILKQIYQKKIFMGENDNISALCLGVTGKSKGEKQ